MQVNKTQPETPKPISRAQRRLNERITEEAKQTYERITENFLQFFIMCAEPEGNEVAERSVQVSRQWRLFCDRKGLKPEAYTIVDDFVRGVIDQYQNP